MLILSHEHLKIIIEHARNEFPYEACGVLAGVNGEVVKVYPLPNENKSEVSYFASPQEQIKVFKKIRRNGWELLGIYHSHPNTAPYPSQRDIELAFYPEAVYLIVSLKSFTQPEVRAFKLEGKKIEEVEVVFKEV